MKIVFLYTRLASYFMASIHELSKHVDEIHIVCRPSDKNAPFSFSPPANVYIHRRNDFTDKTFLKWIDSIGPDLITSSGWRDLGYMAVCRKLKTSVPTVLLMDNQWRNKIRQKILCRLSKRILHTTFTHVWVPGSPQENYALRLGFNPAQINQGFYCADEALFKNVYNDRTASKVYPKRFLFMGRYIHEKGLDTLINAFTALQDEMPNNWELWCAGTGPLADKIKEHPGIKHLGFIQPNQLGEIMKACGVFVLPSRYEQWGVVIQEMTLAGFPIIASSEVGAAHDFIKEEISGYIFKSENTKALKSAMQKIIEKDDSALREMALQSHNAGLLHTPGKWVNTIFKIVAEHKNHQPQ